MSDEFYRLTPEMRKQFLIDLMDGDFLIVPRSLLKDLTKNSSEEVMVILAALEIVFLLMDKKKILTGVISKLVKDSVDQIFSN